MIIYKQQKGKDKGKLAIILKEGRDLLLVNPRNEFKYRVSKQNFDKYYKEVKRNAEID